MQPSFGKVIKTESYFKGVPRGSKIEYHIPEVVTDRNQALNEILGCLNLIDTKKTKEITIVIETDKLGEYKMVTRKYEVEA